jgi:hypothetical protein
MTKKLASEIAWVITSCQTKQNVVSHGWNVYMQKHTMRNPNGDQVVLLLMMFPKNIKFSNMLHNFQFFFFGTQVYNRNFIAFN